MNLLIVIAKHKGLYQKPVSEFSSVIDNSTISIVSHGNILEVHMNTRKREMVALNLFLEIYSLIDICLGAFPSIEAVTFNGNAIDTSDWIDKYRTCPSLFRNDLFISELNATSISQSVMDEYRKKQTSAIYSLQYLTCQNYCSVVADHRITLLLHVIDGIVDINNSQISRLKLEMIAKYGITVKGQPGNYITKVYAMSKECFFNYHRKYNCEILQLLKISQYSFLKIITDTRIFRKVALF